MLKQAFDKVHGATTPMQRRLVFWLCAATVLALCLMPPAPHMPTTGWDKTNHALAFSVLCVLGLLSYPLRTGAALFGLLAFGALIEVLQSLTTYRSAEWLDLLADGAGILAGWLFVRWLASGRPAAQGGWRQEKPPAA